MTSLLKAEDIRTYFKSSRGDVAAVDGVSLEVRSGETLAVVGESGSGKTVLASSIMRLLRSSNVYFPSGKIIFEGKDLLSLPQDKMNSIRGRDMAMVFQEPMAALNPLWTIQDQVAEPLIKHLGYDKTKAYGRCLELLHRLGIPSPERVATAYPHVLSGGMRQRVAIAMALACKPKLLIADEPTTALDVTIQAQILHLIKDLQKEMGMAVLLITHDLGVVNEIADRVMVMKSGSCVETGNASDILFSPKNPYTKQLLAAVPSIDVAPDTDDKADVVPLKPILTVHQLKTWFPVRKGLLRTHVANIKAVDDLSFKVMRGETLAVVGESGCGKSTLGQTALRLIDATGGEIHLNLPQNNVDLLNLKGRALRGVRSHIQMIFQDPYASLNSRLSVFELISEGLEIHEPHLSRDERRQRIDEILAEVGLPADAAMRYPHEFSGGQRQRISIARALILKPKVLVLDEATSALDVSIQAQILTLLQNLQKQYQIAYIFITHNLAVVRQIADRVAVMYLGKIVEIGPTEVILTSPSHPYTQKLIASVPRLTPGAKLSEPLAGDVPSPLHPPSGCTFHPRCPVYQNHLKTTGQPLASCETSPPQLSQQDSHAGSAVRCHYPSPKTFSYLGDKKA